MCLIGKSAGSADGARVWEPTWLRQQAHIGGGGATIWMPCKKRKKKLYCRGVYFGLLPRCANLRGVLMFLNFSVIYSNLKFCCGDVKTCTSKELRGNFAHLRYLRKSPRGDKPLQYRILSSCVHTLTLRVSIGFAFCLASIDSILSLPKNRLVQLMHINGQRALCRKLFGKT